MLILVALVALVAPASPAGAQQTLVLADGDQLTGSLKQIDGTSWTFTYRGEDVVVDASDVAAFTSPDPIGLRLSDNSVVAATIAPVAGGLVLTFSDGTTRTVAASDLEAAGDPGDLDALQEVTLGYFTPFRRFWQMDASLGASLKDGNSNTSAFNARLDVMRSTARDKLALSLLMTQEQNPSEETGEREKTAEKFIGDVRADVFPWERTFLFAQNRYTRDVFKDIDLRINLNVGTGYQFVSTDNTDVRAALGVGGRHEDYASETASQTVATFSVNGGWTQKFGGFEFRTSLDANSAFKELEDYQVLNDNSLTATVVAGLGFRVGLLVEYDNTPTADAEKTDLTFTTALNYTLGG